MYSCACQHLFPFDVDVVMHFLLTRCGMVDVDENNAQQIICDENRAFQTPKIEQGKIVMHCRIRSGQQSLPLAMQAIPFEHSLLFPSSAVLNDFALRVVFCLQSAHTVRGTAFPFLRKDWLC